MFLKGIIQIDIVLLKRITFIQIEEIVGLESE